MYVKSVERFLIEFSKENHSYIDLAKNLVVEKAKLLDIKNIKYMIMYKQNWFLTNLQALLV